MNAVLATRGRFPSNSNNGMVVSFRKRMCDRAYGQSGNSGLLGRTPVARVQKTRSLLRRARRAPKYGEVACGADRRDWVLRSRIRVSVRLLGPRSQLPVQAVADRALRGAASARPPVDGRPLTTWPHGWNESRGFRLRGSQLLGTQPLRAFTSSVSFGTTFSASPTMPRAASWKIGASASLLIAMMRSDDFIPTMCCVAPLIPMAR